MKDSKEAARNPRKDFDEIWDEFFAYKSGFLPSLDPKHEELWWDLFGYWDDIVPAMHCDLEKRGKICPERFEMLSSHIKGIRSSLEKSRRSGDLPYSIVALQYLTVQHLELLKLRMSL